MSKSIDDSVKETTKIKIGQLRDAAHPASGKGLWLRHLNDRQLAEVFHRLRIGQPLLRIARIAQIDWGIQPASSPRSMARGIKIFRDRVLGDLEKIVKSSGKSAKSKASKEELTKGAQRVKKDLDALGRYRWMIEIQTDRLEMIRKKEKDMNGVPMQQFDKAVRELRDSMNSYMAILIKLGIVDSTPDKKSLEVRTAFDGMIDNMSKSGGGAMVNALGNFLTLADKHAIPMTKSISGAFEKVED